MLRRLTVSASLVALVGVTAFLLLQLILKAEEVQAGQRAAPVTPIVDWALNIQLDRAAYRISALGDGWSPPELGSGVWSSSGRAVLKLTTPSAGPVDVALTVAPFLPPGLTGQRVRARLGSHVLGEWRLTEAEPTTLRFQIPTAARRAGDEIQIELELPDAAAPALTPPGSAAPRRQAVKLTRIVVSG